MYRGMSKSMRVCVCVWAVSSYGRCPMFRKGVSIFFCIMCGNGEEIFNRNPEDSILYV